MVGSLDYSRLNVTFCPRRVARVFSETVIARRFRIPFTIAAAVLAAAMALTACTSPAAPGHAGSQSVPPSYYLALGDSLAQGVQPNAAGTSVETAQGYPDLVYAALHRDHPGLRLVRLGCPGETTDSMMHGGICSYPGGSQLAAADAFLRAHRGRVFLVTLDIGANDAQSCASQPSLTKLVTCVAAATQTAGHLATILASLRAATSARIVGMSYYLPELAQWRTGILGHAIAWTSERIAVGFNDLLGNAYAKANIKVADVFDAFHTTDFGNQQTVTGMGTVPRNVALICQWTWECAPPPRGPNQHANPAGYRVIATEILKAANLG